ISITITVICAVPDLAGFPPSMAVSTNWYSRFSSRSRACSSTSSGKSLPSLSFFTFSEKCGLGLSR
uniref:Uncharacterized protein n=1 Tax=Chelydra serpentina TaxID=8475 RepID=A0A8C3RYD9_CHESE